jgi:hypothetical protein
MPEPPGFVMKNGTEQVCGSGQTVGRYIEGEAMAAGHRDHRDVDR